MTSLSGRRIGLPFLAILCILASLLVPGIASASSASVAKTRVWAFDVTDQTRVGVERALTLELRPGCAPTYDQLASDSLLAARGGARAAGKEPNRIYSARELVRRSEAGDSFHNFPESFNKSIFSGNRQVISDDYVLYTQRGAINGVEGTFEIGVRPSASGGTEVITHRFFRPDR